MAVISKYKSNYELLWSTMIVKPGKEAVVHKVASAILSNKFRYTHISDIIRNTYAASGIPWYFIACVHHMECGLSFLHHLHNGDPLSHRTVHVPAGRPVKGNPPFTFEQSAVDALEYQELHLETDWSVPNMLYKFEAYNGFGYQSRSINSPYLWSFSNHYTKGKYVKDGVFDPNAVSDQLGAAVILKQILK